MSPPRIRLLLVHDDALDRRAIVRFIQNDRLPYEVVAVGSLAEAGSLLAHRTFDVAVIDQRLGDGIGIDLIPNLAGTPAIVLVRAGEEAEAAPALATGANGFVVRDAARRYLPLLAPAVNGALARRRAETMAARRAEDLLRAQSEFQRLASMMWHDIMRPLTRLVSTTEMLQANAEHDESPAAPEMRPLIKQTVETAIELEGLVTDVLGYYRLESPPALVTVDLDALIHEVVASLPPRLWHDAVLDVAPLPSVVGDPARLRVLFRQLLEGAHRLRGSEALEVGIMADEYDDGVRLSVTDNGLGTSGTSRGRTELRSGEPAGDEAGLGIAICRRIVEQHGGRIWIQSAPQRGTTVYLTLPKASPRDQHVYAGHRPSDSFVRFVASTGESP